MDVVVKVVLVKVVLVVLLAVLVAVVNVPVELVVVELVVVLVSAWGTKGIQDGREKPPTTDSSLSSPPSLPAALVGPKKMPTPKAKAHSTMIEAVLTMEPEAVPATEDPSKGEWVEASLPSPHDLEPEPHPANPAQSLLPWPSRRRGENSERKKTA